jgi:hypothetical protein
MIRSPPLCVEAERTAAAPGPDGLDVEEELGEAFTATMPAAMQIVAAHALRSRNLPKTRLTIFPLRV